MTLVVSLRIADGVILSADSLQTSMSSLQPELKDFKVKSPSTGEEIIIPKVKLPPIKLPSSTSSFAQKLFSFKKKYGVAIFGSNILNGRTIYNHIKTLEKSIDGDISMADVQQKIQTYFQPHVDKQIAALPNYDKRRTLFGLQIVGFENEDDITGTTLEFNFGSNSKIIKHKPIGCTLSGDSSFGLKIFEAAKERSPINIGGFSLQDGIDFCEFLTNSTTDFQRFANMIPTVGGSVDIALITKYSDFNWIKAKSLAKMLEQ